MSTKDVTARHTVTADPTGRESDEERVERILAEIAAHNAAFQHAPFCDYLHGGAHPCTGTAPMLPGVVFSVRERVAEVSAYPWREEGTGVHSIALVIEEPYCADQENGDVLAEAWLQPSTARALAAQLLAAARQADAELSAVAESDAQLTELGVLVARVEAGDFATITEVGDALRQIVGVA